MGILSHKGSWSGTDHFTDAEDGPPGGWEAISDAGSGRVSMEEMTPDLDTPPQIKYTEDISDAAWIQFISEDGKRVWKELARLFADESASFTSLIKHDIAYQDLDLDPLHRLPGLLRSPDRLLQYELRGITPWDFDALVAGLRPRLGVEIPYEQLCPMLALATDWNFPSLRTYAITALSEILDEPPIPRILLARRSSVKDWLLPAYTQLAQRLPPLTAHESDLLGNLPTLAVFRARFAVLESRMRRVAGPRPSVLMGKSTFWHPSCWTIICTAWRTAITVEVGEIEDVMMEALRDLRTPKQGQRRGMTLCRNCNSYDAIVGWMQLELDEAVALKVLQPCLGDMEPWISMNIG